MTTMRALCVAVALSAAAFLAAPQGALADDYIIRRHYQVEPGEPLEPILRGYIAERQRMLAAGAGDRNQIELDLGDAYHWLGHHLEDNAVTKEQFMEGQDAHRASLLHYQRSGIRNSSRIRGLPTVRHAYDHLTILREERLQEFEERTRPKPLFQGQGIGGLCAYALTPQGLMRISFGED